MSNPPSSLRQQQRMQQHRRQNSTPVVAFEAMKVSQPTPQRQNMHRRGQSFDYQQQQQRSPIRRQQQNGMVNITNLGHHGQQILREAQQQRLARPGQQQHTEIPQSPQCGNFMTGSPSIPVSPYENMTMNGTMQSSSMQVPHSQYYTQEMNLPMSAGLHGMGVSFDENSQHYFQQAHMVPQTAPMMQMPEDRRMSQPDLRIQTGLRPFTPTQQVQTGMLRTLDLKDETLTSLAHFPLTPSSTPFRSDGYSRSLQSSPSSHYLNAIQEPCPVSMQRSRSLHDIVEAEEQKHSFEVADMPYLRSFSTEEPIKRSMEEEDEYLSQLDDPTQVQMPKLEDQPVPTLASTRAGAGSSSPSRPALSPRRMSISDLNLEPGISASIEETNVTLDDIAQFIEGPDPVDNKWICKFDDCNKRFGRKENIKSHVQTHLGDRQFRCDHCKKCFVRGHDLKRHAKIHTGTKPYPCLCGNSFARHDALTRHRQRGMCIGAFDGVVKKVIKRGRPRKHRPEMDERMDKASRSRHAHDPHDQYASSASSCSLSSWGSPPTENLESLSIRGSSPFDDMALFDMPQQQVDIQNMSMPPQMFSFTPPASPGYSTGNKPSPSYRSLTPTDIADIQCVSHNTMQSVPEFPSASLMAGNMVLQLSHQSLPSLSHSSSSPIADVAAFDFSEDMNTAARMGVKVEERNEFDNFLDYGGVDMSFDPNGADSFFTNL